MKNKIVLATALMLALSTPVFAHGDEDHGATVVAPAAQNQPFAEAHSQDFELVLTLAGSQAQLYLDRYVDNQPVEGAQVDMDYAGQTVTFKPVGPGEYTASAPALSKAGQYPLSFTVIAGDTSDLLESTLIVASAPSAENHANRPPWPYWLSGGVALLLLGGSALIFRRRFAGART